MKYDKEITSAPIVTYLSKKIKETEKFAQDLSISIIKNNIADKIVSILDIGDEIPVSLPFKKRGYGDLLILMEMKLLHHSMKIMILLMTVLL